MNQRLIQQIGRTQRLKVITELKRTQGLPVRELATRLGMSYMGAKDICVDLEKRGFLDTWRQPQKLGRPLMLYRLTHRAHELFPVASNPMTIEVLGAAQKLFGPTAAEKMLHIVFHEKTEQYCHKAKGATAWQRATALVRLRDAEGAMSCLAADEDSFTIREHHCPIYDLLRAFPIIAKLEAEMFSRVLQASVRREESCVSGLYCVTFTCAEPAGVAAIDLPIRRHELAQKELAG